MIQVNFEGFKIDERFHLVAHLGKFTSFREFKDLPNTNTILEVSSELSNELGKKWQLELMKLSQEKEMAKACVQACIQAFFDASKKQ